MYKLHLILKYLRKRRIAWVSLIAVMLCTAMVLVVISVMGGWLETFKQKFRGMSGDVVVWRPGLTGFSGYEQMLADIRALPEVDEALPLIRTFGLVNVSNQIRDGVQVTGLDIERYSKFNSFRESLWRQYQKPLLEGKTPPPNASFDLLPTVDYQMWRPKDPRATRRPGMIVGGPLVGLKKGPDGTVIEPAGLYEAWVSLDVFPAASEFARLQDVQPSNEVYWIVDASRTQLYQLDSNSVYVPFDVLQKNLNMDARPFINADTGKEEIAPARCTELQIKLKPGANRDQAVIRVREVVDRIHGVSFEPIYVQTWDRMPMQAKFLGAVENEKLMMTILFGVISIVAIFLIFCILYMIVVEKTRDIGIVKSVGATSSGVAGIFLGYGLAIGIVGGLAGLVAGWLFLHYINEIHDGIARLSGFHMWDPEVYAFDRIPSTMDPLTATIVVLVAILSAVLGAVVPAIRAARLNPIEALRFE